MNSHTSMRERSVQPAVALTVLVAVLLAVTALASTSAARVSSLPAAGATPVAQQMPAITADAAGATLPFLEPQSPPSGNLGPTFDGDGKFTTVFGSEWDYARAECALLLQPTGAHEGRYLS